ncbi:hypothetical protein HanIR_Chr10g0475791 [Helianthus annuus]|nr:hypothetical protein HanIR_Chr10g0475791 [Helianthus annuus]
MTFLKNITEDVPRILTREWTHTYGACIPPYTLKPSEVNVSAIIFVFSLYYPTTSRIACNN